MDDVIYIFGGRGVDGKDLGDLAAFKLSSEYIYSTRHVSYATTVRNCGLVTLLDGD